MLDKHTHNMVSQNMAIWIIWNTVSIGLYLNLCYFHLTSKFQQTLRLANFKHDNKLQSPEKQKYDLIGSITDQMQHG